MESDDILFKGLHLRTLVQIYILNRLNHIALSSIIVFPSQFCGENKNITPSHPLISMRTNITFISPYQNLFEMLILPFTLCAVLSHQAFLSISEYLAT